MASGGAKTAHSMYITYASHMTDTMPIRNEKPYPINHALFQPNILPTYIGSRNKKTKQQTKLKQNQTTI